MWLYFSKALSCENELWQHLGHGLYVVLRLLVCEEMIHTAGLQVGKLSHFHWIEFALGTLPILSIPVFFPRAERFHWHWLLRSG